MANLSAGYVFGETESVTNAKLAALVNSGTISGIVNADIDAGAAIAFSKIAQANIDGSLLTGLANIVSGAGVIPVANLTSVAQKGSNSDITSLSGLTTALSTAQGGTGSTANANAANGVVVLDVDKKLPAVDGSQLTGILVGGYTGMQLFTSSGTWTKPTGITKVLVKLVGGGGGGGYNSGGGGGGGGYAEGVVSVTGDISVTVGTGGSGTTGGTGGTGGTSSFSTLSATGGGGGVASGGAGGAGGTGNGTLNFTGGIGGTNGNAGGSPLGFGCGGGGYNNTAGGLGFWSKGGGTGSSATGYGAGGIGGGSSANGGNGTSGIVIVYW